MLIARVHKPAPPAVIAKRNRSINRFEQGLVADGTVPAKLWKYSPGDVDERALWAAVSGGLPDRAGEVLDP